MASKVELCSLALIEVGSAPITSLDEDNDRAQTCALKFPGVLDEVIREHPWNATMVRQQLAQVGTGPIFGWDFAYTLPTDPWCLRVWETSIDVSDGSGQWKVEGRQLLCNESSISIAYGGRPVDMNILDASLSPAVVLKLAHRIAYPLTGKRQIAADLEALYLDELKRAKAINDQEQSKRSYGGSSPLTRVRQG